MSDYEMSVEPLFITPLAKVDLSSCITPSEVAFTDNHQDGAQPAEFDF